MRIVQGGYHRAYNTRAFRVESRRRRAAVPGAARPASSQDPPGTVHLERFARVEALAVRVVVTSVYPNIDYSSPGLAEMDLRLGERSWLAAGRTVRADRRITSRVDPGRLPGQ